MKLKPNLLVWPVKRSKRSFRFYVVEPRECIPEQNSKVFNAALESFIAYKPSYINPYHDAYTINTMDHFDLITFPEAFLPQNNLLSVLSQLPEIDSIGCVHVGLRPSEAEGHLFRTNELKILIDSLKKNKKIKGKDLIQFSNWLKSQPDNGRFNIGCLFTIDANRHIRICLHPKLVRSKFERSPMREKNMDEADLLTLVVLQPKDRSLLSVAIQPLICSDALFHATDSPHCRPLDAVNSSADCFRTTPPDHIDIISVATCSPNQEQELKGMKYRQWHEDFRRSFKRTVSDAYLVRHNYSMFVLSNYEVVPMAADKPGGLSGAFIPLPLRDDNCPPYVSICSWGRPINNGNSSNRWSQPGDKITRNEWSGLNYIASLNPIWSNESDLARMLGFTINSLPRHSTRRNDPNDLINFQFQSAAYNAIDSTVVFRKEDV